MLTWMDGVPTDLNRRMSAGELDISVVSAVEYARDSYRYLLLSGPLLFPAMGPFVVSCFFPRRSAAELSSRNVIISRSSMTSVALLELLFENVWATRTALVAGDAEIRTSLTPNDDGGRRTAGDRWTRPSWLVPIHRER